MSDLTARRRRLSAGGDNERDSRRDHLEIRERVGSNDKEEKGGHGVQREAIYTSGCLSSAPSPYLDFPETVFEIACCGNPRSELLQLRIRSSDRQLARIKDYHILCQPSHK